MNARENPSARAGNMTIGTLSKRSGVNIETIRYYERIGLMLKPARSEGGYRLYSKDEAKRLTFIRRARELGFTLKEVRALLGLVRGHHLTCAEVKALTEEHVADIRRKIRDLKKLDRALTGLAARCHGKNVPDCPILETLGA